MFKGDDMNTLIYVLALGDRDDDSQLFESSIDRDQVNPKDRGDESPMTARWSPLAPR
jgi:hypothetical protein